MESENFIINMKGPKNGDFYSNSEILNIMKELDEMKHTNITIDEYYVDEEINDAKFFGHKENLNGKMKPFQININLSIIENLFKYLYIKNNENLEE